MFRLIRNTCIAPLPLCAAVCAALLWPALSANAASPTSVSLDQAIRLAVQRAPSLDARDALITAAGQEVARAGALPDPKLMAGLDNWPVTGADAFALDANTMTMQRIGIRQDVPARAKRDAREQLAARNVDQAEALALAERLNVRREVANAWIGVWATRRGLDALQALRDEAALASKVARARVSGGSATVSEALAAEAAVLELDNRVQAFEAEVIGAQALLTRWLGPGFTANAAADPPIEALSVDGPSLVAAIDRLGPLLPWQARLETAAAEVDLARADKRPDWSVTAAYGQRLGGRSDMLMLEFSIDLPWFTANRQDRGIAAREADYQATLASREDTRRQIAAEIHRRFAEWQGLRGQNRRDREQLLPLTRDRSEVALAAYRGGAALQPWLDARRDELDTVTDHVARLRALGQAWASLAFLLPETPPGMAMPSTTGRFEGTGQGAPQ